LAFVTFPKEDRESDGEKIRQLANSLPGFFGYMECG